MRAENQLRHAMTQLQAEYDAAIAKSRTPRAYAMGLFMAIETLSFALGLDGEHPYADLIGDLPAAELPQAIEPEEYAGRPYRWILYTYLGGERVDRQVTKAEWVAAERAAGFTGGRPGEPSTGGWGNGTIGGTIRPVTE